ncbi:MAG: class I SAM-dependent methyltransferase [Nitrospirota bacterium]
MATHSKKNPDALPQLIGEFKPVDEWQAHVGQIFYGLLGGRVRDYYQTFGTADYRLAHALAADYFERVVKRDALHVTREESRHPSPVTRHAPPLTVMEWGCGNGNLAACFLTHLKTLDKEGTVYPRIRYVLVDSQPAIMEAARTHPDLAPHLERVETLCAGADNLASVRSGTVDRIFCNELWNELPTKLMLRKGTEIEEEHLRPNLSEAKHAAIADWSGFIRAFEEKDVQALRAFPPFLEDIIWEREYHKTEWKSVPYRKTITEFLKKIDEQVLVPVNLGAFGTVKEAVRLLAPDAAGFSSFDAGTRDLKVLNDPEKPCYGLFGGQYSFMVNFALVEAVAGHLGLADVTIEAQNEFVGRSLGTNVLTLMDLLATYPSAGTLKPWERDRLVVKTIRVLNEHYRSPYERKIEFPLAQETPREERELLEGLLQSLKRDGVPDTVAYLSEEELLAAMPGLEGLGYEPDLVKAALRFPQQPVDYYHFSFAPVKMKNT